MIGEIVHIELPSRDFARSATFYAKLFGWKTDGIQSGGHLMFELPGAVQGSWIRDALAQTAGPVPFVAVADVDKTLAEAERQGGRILVHRLPLANRGTFGLLADCDGNVIGVLSAKDASAARGVDAPDAARKSTDKPTEKSGDKPATKPVPTTTTEPAAQTAVKKTAVKKTAVTKNAAARKR